MNFYIPIGQKEPRKPRETLNEYDGCRTSGHITYSFLDQGLRAAEKIWGVARSARLRVQDLGFRRLGV